MTASSGAPQELTRSQARAAGGFYLGTIATGIFAEGFARSGLAVKGDAVATAQNILSRETLYRAGLASDIVMLSFYIAVTMLLYAMFAATSRKVSLVAAGFSMTGITVLAASSLALFIPLLQPDAAIQSGGLGLNVVASQALALHAEGYGVSLVFFGSYCVLLGYLIWRSGLVPRTIGVLMAIGGAAHLISSFTGIAAPPVAQELPAQMPMLPLLGELALSLWLLLFGIRQPGQVVSA